ncbi:hypothetical protein D3C87_82330 [compost metagenome]
MKKFSLTAIVAILVSMLFSFWSYLGIWVPNAFGTGTLWLIIAALISIWFWNTHVDEKNKK